MNVMSELILTIVLPIVLAPIFIGIGLGLLVGATGISFYSIVILCMALCWGVVGLYFYS